MSILINSDTRVIVQGITGSQGRLHTEKMLELAHGESALGNTLREGLVVRSQDGRKSFKAVDPEFLIYYGI